MRNRFFARSFAILIALFIMTLGSLSAHAASATVTFSTADNAYMSDTTGDATPDLLVKSVTAGQTASISFSAVPPQGASGIMAQLQAYSAGIDAWAGLDGETRLCISAPAGHVFDLSGFKYATGNLVSNIYIGTETNDGYYATVANQFAGESTLVSVDASGYGITGVNKVYLSASEDIVLFQDIVISNIKIKLSTPGSLAWDGTVPGKAVWNPVVNASSYTVQLYKDGVIYGTASSVSTPYCDFSSAIASAGSGSYTYTVTAIGDGTTYAGSDQSAASPAYSYTAFVAVTGISGAPNSATAGENLTLSGTVAPAEATNKTITWSVVSAGTTGASISDNTLSTTAAGTATIRATITNGLSASSDYTEDFTITVNAAFVPVTDITGLPTSAIAGTSLTLSGTVEPASATNKTITWSVLDQGFTGATLSGNTLSIPSPGTILLEATVVNGLTASTHYHKYIYISVFSPVPVTGITGVPTSATAGTPLTLSGTVEPANATNKTIIWSVASAGTTGASISGNILSTTAAGTATIRATIANGLAASSDYTEDFTVTVNPAFVPVTSITGLPTSATAGEALTLSGTVAPADATNKTITWSVIGVSTTGATISGNTLSTTGEGVALIRATVVNGFTASSDYTRDFMITVNPAVIPVTDITGVPTSAIAGTSLTLSGTVEPASATNKTITWNVLNPGTTGATLSGNTLSIPNPGTILLEATVVNGLTTSTHYHKYIYIEVISHVPVTGISGVPTSATAGTPLTLSGTVEPADATNKTITWNVASAGTTGASVSGNTLSTTAAGTVIIRATIANGAGPSSSYNKDFSITVNAAFVPVTGISGVPTSATAGTPLTLSGTVEPADATNKTITWNVASAGTTGASISGDTLSTTAAGTATIRATITNGLTASSDYTQDFTVTVNPAMSEDTLTEAVGSTTISAQGVFAPGAALVVTVLPSGEDDREELETLMGDKQILGAYEARITPAGAYTPPLTLTFEVGEEHNGSTVYVLHKLGSGGTEQFTPTVTNGAVSIIVNELSPFLLAKDLSLTITSQPQDVRAVAGQTVSFSVWATGEAPLTYQWQRKISSGSSEKRQSKTPSSWKRIDGATAPDYTIDRIDLSQNGSQYRVIVTDGLDNSIASSAATLTVTKASSPDTGDHAQPALYALLAALFAAALVLLLKKRRAS